MKPAFAWRLISAVVLFVVLVALTFGPMHAIATLLFVVAPLLPFGCLIVWAFRRVSNPIRSPR